MQLEKEMRDAAEDVINFSKAERAIDVDVAIKIAEKYAKEACKKQIKITMRELAEWGLFERLNGNQMEEVLHDIHNAPLATEQCNADN